MTDRSSSYDSVADALTRAIDDLSAHGLDEFIEPESLGEHPREDDEIIRAALLAFAMKPNFRGSALDRWRIRYVSRGPVAESWRAQAPMKEWASDDLVDHWWALSQAASSARVVSRLADLVWCSRPFRNEAAQLAVDSYVEGCDAKHLSKLAALPGHWFETGPESERGPRRIDHYVTSKVGRAREIAVTRKDLDSLAMVDDRLDLHALQAIDGQRPGAVADILRTCSQPVRLRPSWFVGRCVEALSVCETKAFPRAEGLDSLCDYLSSAASSEDERKLIRTRQIELWLLASESDTPANRFAILHEAYRVSVEHGLPDLAALCQRMRAEVDPMDGTDPILDETPIPEEIFAWAAAERDKIVTAPTLKGALRRIGLLEPLTGSLTTHRADALEALRNAPGFLDNSPNLELGGKEHLAESEDQLATVKAAESAKEEANFRATMIVAPAFHEVGRRFDCSIEELTSAFDHEFIDELRARRLALGVQLFLERQPDAAVHVALPAIESILRELARRLGLAIPTPARTNADGMIALLGQVISELSDVGLPEDLVEYWKFVLVEVPGFNLRNSVLHGDRRATSDSEAALVLHIASGLLGVTAVSSVRDPTD